MSPFYRGHMHPSCLLSLSSLISHLFFIALTTSWRSKYLTVVYFSSSPLELMFQKCRFFACFSPFHLWPWGEHGELLVIICWASERIERYTWRSEVLTNNLSQKKIFTWNMHCVCTCLAFNKHLWKKCIREWMITHSIDMKMCPWILKEKG